MKKIFSLIFLFTLCLTAQDTGTVTHPEPKPPHYLEEKWYETLNKQMLPRPHAESFEQRADEAELLKLQKSRSQKDCERAKSEVFVSLENFFGGPGGALDSTQVEKLTPFFDQIRNDGDFFIQKLKKEYPRKRPHLYVKKLEPCVPKEVTFAYPSGHAVLSRLYSLVLSELYPEKKDVLKARAERIASDRVLSGMHHPTDIAAGKKLGDLLFEQLKKTPSFQADLKKLR